MAPMSRRDIRLRRDYEDLVALAADCLAAGNPEPGPRFEFQHNGDIEAGEYPDIYTVTLRVRGMQPGIPPTERYKHQFDIYLQSGAAPYPASPPMVRWITPVLHPNIKTPREDDAEIQQIARELRGDVKSLVERMREDERLARLMEDLKGYVCLDVLRANWTPAVGLDDLVIELANMVRLKTYNLDSVLDPAAKIWVREREEAHALPLETDGLVKVQESTIGALPLLKGSTP